MAASEAWAALEVPEARATTGAKVVVGTVVRQVVLVEMRATVETVVHAGRAVAYPRLIRGSATAGMQRGPRVGKSQRPPPSCSMCPGTSQSLRTESLACLRLPGGTRGSKQQALERR